jgi:hypothetical protein
MGLTTLGTQDTNRHGPYNIGYKRSKQTRAWSVCILCTQCCQARVCFYLVYPMLPGSCLFLSCVPNFVRPVSFCILCTQCCQASVCLYHVYPMLRGPCLFETDTGLTTLGTQDKNRHWHGNIGYIRKKETRAWQHSVHKIQTDTAPCQCLFLSCVPNVVRPVSVFILCTQCCQASICFYLVYPMLPC